MVWVLRDGKPVRTTIKRRLINITTKEKGRAHWHIIRDAAEEGLTIEEAARRAGMKRGGVESLLYRRTGSTVWPPKSETAE